MNDVQELQTNPATGEMDFAPVAVPVAVAAVAPGGVATSAAKQSFFEDDEGDTLFSGAILLDGAVVRVRELTAAEMTIYNHGEKNVNALIQNLRKSSDNTEIDAISEKIKLDQMANYDAVIAAAVASWELKRPDGTPVPCTPESKLKLRASKKAELTDKIVQRSSIGRDLSSFLAES